MAPLKPVRAASLAAFPVAVGVVAAAVVSVTHSGGPDSNSSPVHSTPISSTPDSNRHTGVVQRTEHLNSAQPHPYPGTPSPAGTVGTVAAAGGGPGSSVADLTLFTPVQEFNISHLRTGPVRINGTSYTDSISFSCDTSSHVSSGDLDYPVTGYGALTTTIAVGPGQAGVASVSFFNNGTGSQVAGPFLVSPGHPQPIRISFPGASQLEVSCTAAGPRPATPALALANPVLRSR